MERDETAAIYSASLFHAWGIHTVTVGIAFRSPYRSSRATTCIALSICILITGDEQGKTMLDLTKGTTLKALIPRYPTRRRRILRNPL